MNRSRQPRSFRADDRERRALDLAERLKETVGSARGPDVNGSMVVVAEVAVEELRELAERLDPSWRSLLRIEPAA
jgi:hypothetical protein